MAQKLKLLRRCPVEAHKPMRLFFFFGLGSYTGEGLAYGLFRSTCYPLVRNYMIKSKSDATSHRLVLQEAQLLEKNWSKLINLYGISLISQYGTTICTHLNKNICQAPWSTHLYNAVHQCQSTFKTKVVWKIIDPTVRLIPKSKNTLVQNETGNDVGVRLIDKEKRRNKERDK